MSYRVLREAAHSSQLRCAFLCVARLWHNSWRLFRTHAAPWYLEQVNRRGAHRQDLVADLLLEFHVSIAFQRRQEKIG